MNENAKPAALPECTDLNPCGKCAVCLWSYEQYCAKEREREAEEGSCYEPDEARGPGFCKAFGL